MGVQDPDRYRRQATDPVRSSGGYGASPTRTTLPPEQWVLEEFRYEGAALAKAVYFTQSLCVWAGGWVGWPPGTSWQLTSCPCC